MKTKKLNKEPIVLIWLVLVFLSLSVKGGQPSNQPTGLVTGGATTNSLTISFTNAIGNPTGYLLIFKAGSSATNGVPVDGTTYFFGNSLGGGTVGAKGIPPFVITGLAAGQQYFFDIYSYNGSGGGINYLQSIAPLEGSAWTLAASPAAQPGNLTFNAITSTGLNGTFVAASPIPSGGYFGLRKAGSAVTDMPTDGVSYAAGSTIGTSSVLFTGPSLSFAEAGLSPSTTYFYTIFSYGIAGDPSTINYLTTAPLSNSQATVATPPTIQASGLTISGVTHNQMTLNWTSGNGARRILLAHASNAINANPVNGSAYTPNSMMGSGSQIGVGNYVVYDGTGISVTITAMSPSVMYYFESFEYNGTASTANYLTLYATGNPVSQTTLAAPPSTQTSSILFSSVSNAQMTLSWTSGNGSRRIILGHQNAAVNVNPGNGATYSSNSVFASGNQLGVGNYVVYDGVGNSTTITGLLPSTLYDFQSFEYNGTTNTTNYLALTAAGNPAGQTTLANPPLLQTHDLFFTNVTNTTMTVSWTRGNGSRRLVLAHAATTVNAIPVAFTMYTANSLFGNGSLLGTGNYVVYDGSDSTVDVSGLSGNTIYYFEVFEYNGSALTANYLGTPSTANPSGKITLANPATVQSTSIVFTSISPNQSSMNWTRGNGAGCLVIIQSGSQSNDVARNATAYTANSVFGSGAVVGSHFVVYNGTGSNVTISGLSPSVFYYVQVIEFTGTGATSNYLSDIALGNPSYQSTVAIPASIQTSAVVFTGITNNQATVTWTNGNGSKRMILAHANTTVDANPVNATAYVTNNVFGSGSQLGTGNYVIGDGPTQSITLTGLSPSVSYYVKVNEYNGGGADNNFNTTLASGNPAKLTTRTDAPVVNAVLAIGSNSFAVNWIPVYGATGYYVDISTDNFITFVSGYNNFFTSGTSVNVTGLSTGTSYQCVVRSQNVTGTSANSSMVSVFTPPAAPVAAAGTQVTATAFTAGWSTSFGASGYFLDASTDINFGTFVAGFNNQSYTTATAVLISGLLPGTLYYYRVRSANAGGTSANSAIITQITVPEIPVAQNSSNEQTDNFIANWSTVKGADSYELDVTLNSSNFSTFVTNYNAHFIPDGAQTQEVVTGLAANTIYKYRVRARNAGGVSASSPSKAALTLKSNGGTILPPTIAVLSSSSSRIIADASNGFDPATNVITFLHRKITEQYFTSESDIIGSTASVVVDAAWLDQLGVEYYFRVQDEADKKDSTGHQFIYSMVSNINLSSQSSFVAGGTSESYRIFSIPVQLASTRIEDIFQPVEAKYGGVNNTKWRLVHYENGQNVDYGAGLNTIDQGRSYWFNSLGTPPVINLSGTVPAANQSKGFVLALDAGFTQIGNPYPFGISWNDVLAENSGVANIDGVGSLYTYDAAHVAFIKDAPLLKAWEGGFVHSNAPVQITIPVTTKQERVGTRQGFEITATALDQPAWFLPIRVSLGPSFNNYSGVGMHPEAQQGYDHFDGFTAPRFINYLELNSYHPEYHTPRFSRDIVATAANHTWSFVIESNFDEHNAVITWDNQLLGENEAQLFLLDEEAREIIDMKKTDIYTFSCTGKRTFKVFFSVDEKSLASDVTLLSQAFPNPFSVSVTIPFITGEDKPMVEIELFDLMGTRIQELAHNQFEPGYHECTWNGTDYTGARVSQGIYLYRLTSSNVPPQVGKVVLK
jgi:hypothetical protein